MIIRKLAHDRVLDGIKILEFVHEHRIPAAADGGSDVVDSEDLRRPEKQPIEVDDVSVGECLPIPVVEFLVSMSERLAAKAVAREGVQNTLSHSARNFDPHKN